MHKTGFTSSQHQGSGPLLSLLSRLILIPPALPPFNILFDLHCEEDDG